MRRWDRLAAGVVVGACLQACAKNSVQWSEPVATSNASTETELVVDSGGRMSWRSLPAQPTGPRTTDVYTQSVRARAGTHALYAVWWTARPDSAATLHAGRSVDNGASWTSTAVIDSADASLVGCRRPPPSIAVVADDVYVAYAMKARDGTGVFFAHSMGGGTMFHAPVPIVYGDRLVSTAVASDGDRVAVAYEEPNGATRSVSVALSRTQGHIFETRVAASPHDTSIFLPRVAIAGPTIAVGWMLQAAGANGIRSVTRIGRMSD